MQETLSSLLGPGIDSSVNGRQKDIFNKKRSSERYFQQKKRLSERYFQQKNGRQKDIFNKKTVVRKIFFIKKTVVRKIFSTKIVFRKIFSTKKQSSEKYFQQKINKEVYQWVQVSSYTYNGILCIESVVMVRGHFFIRWISLTGTKVMYTYEMFVRHFIVNTEFTLKLLLVTVVNTSG